MSVNAKVWLSDYLNRINSNPSEDDPHFQETADSLIVDLLSTVNDTAVLSDTQKSFLNDHIEEQCSDLREAVEFERVEVLAVATYINSCK